MSLITSLTFYLMEIQEQSEGDYERNRLSDQLVEVQQQRDQLEGLGNFMEQEKARLQDKLEKMTADGRLFCLGFPGSLSVLGWMRPIKTPQTYL